MARNSIKNWNKKELIIGNNYKYSDEDEKFKSLIQIGNYFKSEKKLYAKIPNAGWAEKEILHKDYKSIRKIYEILLDDILCSENHRSIINFKNLNKRKLELLIGVWLKSFTLLVFRSVKEFEVLSRSNKYRIKGIKKINEENKRPIDMSDYFANFITNYDVIDNLKLDILKLLKLVKEDDIEWNTFQKKRFTIINHIKIGKLINYFFKSITIEILLRILKNIKSPKSNLICDPDIWRKLKFRIFDINKWIYSLHKKTISHEFYRIRLKHLVKSLDIKSNNDINNDISELEFEAKVILIIKKLLSNYIPASLYHGLKLSIERCKNVFPIVSPNNIITSSNILTDEIFNIFIIKNICKNSKYSIIQHGGGYGFSIINDEEEYQLNTADYFFSWGWKENIIYPNKNRINALVLNNYGCFVNKNQTQGEYLSASAKNFKTNKILIALNEWKKIDFRLYSYPTSDGFDSKYLNLIKFINNLDVTYKKKIALRGYLNGPYKLKKFIENFFSYIEFFDRTKSSLIENLRKGSYLFITDGNSTSWLEALEINIPTILILGNDFKDINDKLLPLFKKCLDNSLIFEDPIKASCWINSNFETIDKWWFSKEVQIYRKKILNQFFNHKISIYNLIDFLSSNNKLS
mgnify:CR=1 FL=1|tara:strand:+ start:39693 stop:41594 length:1902 start_codon:yes stop_codon:yes gene_type:complete